MQWLPPCLAASKLRHPKVGICTLRRANRFKKARLQTSLPLLRSKMHPQAQGRPSSLFESFTHAAAKMEAGWSFPDEWQTYVPNWTVWRPEKPLWRTDDSSSLTEHAAMARQPATSRCIWRLRSGILQGIGGLNKAQYRDEYRYPGESPPPMENSSHIHLLRQNLRLRIDVLRSH